MDHGTGQDGPDAARISEGYNGYFYGLFVGRMEKSTGTHGTMRENPRDPSKHARLLNFVPITGTDGTVNFPHGVPSLWEIRGRLACPFFPVVDPIQHSWSCNGITVMSAHPHPVLEST